MPTLGFSSIAGINATNQAPTDLVVVGGPYVAGGSGVLGNGYMNYHAINNASNGDTQSIRLIAYNNNAGAVGTLLGVTDAVTVIQGTTPTDSFVQFPSWSAFGGPPSVTGGVSYWVGLWWGTAVGAGGPQTAINVQQPGNTQFFNNAETYSTSGNPPNIPASSGGNQDYVIYFDVNPPATIGVTGTFVTHRLGGMGW